MKKILLLIFSFIILFSQSIAMKDIPVKDLPIGYSKLFDCEKWIKFDTNDCNVEIYYNNNNLGEIDFLIVSREKINYTIYMYNILGKKVFEKDITNQDFFKQSDIKQGWYYIKIANRSGVFNKRISIN